MLSLHDLHVHLDAESGVVHAIDALSLTLERGETFALVGESGCGKSMTALALMRLLPENGQVTGGEVRLGSERDPHAGIELLALPERAMRAVRGGRIGMIFQEPGTSLNPVLKVGVQMVEAIEAHTDLRGDAAREKAIQWLERVGIPEPRRRIDEYPFRMSGGQKQRVMIAMTLATEPEFLVADEPTTALDVTIQAQILELLKDLQRERRLGLLLITHDLAVVSGMAQRVALMYAGQIVEVARAAEFFAAPRHPYAQALLRALPDAANRGAPLEAIGGTVPALSQTFAGCRFEPRCAHAMAHCAGSLPPVVDVGAGHEVRCWLYAREGGSGRAEFVEASARPSTGSGRTDTGSGRTDEGSGRTGEGSGRAGEGAGRTGEGFGRTHEGPARAAGPLLDVQNLTVRFVLKRSLLGGARQHFDAVRDVSFQVNRGETLALVGESGCGKTTTGKAIVQLLRELAVIDGRANLEGRNLFALQGAELVAARRDVQIVFQDPFASLDPRMRVAELLDEGLAALRPETTAGERRARIEALVERVGLRRDALERWPHEFSGGQRQRIAIARALAVGPKLIVCDEPTSALDVSVQAQILNLLRELQRELGVSYLFITHNIGVVEYIADRIAVMQAGRIVEQGACDAVLGAPREAYTRTLLAAVPRLHAAAPAG